MKGPGRPAVPPAAKWGNTVSRLAKEKRFDDFISLILDEPPPPSRLLGARAAATKAE